MKFNLVNSVIAYFIAVLIALAFTQMPDAFAQKIWLASGAGIGSLVCLAFGIGIKYSNPRIATNIRILSFLFLTLILIANIIFGFFIFKAVWFLIVMGLLILVYILVLNSLLRVMKTDPAI